MTDRLTLAFNSVAGVLPRDAENLWRVDGVVPPTPTRDLALATGAAWPISGIDVVAVPEAGSAGLDSVGDVTIAWAGGLDLAAIGTATVPLVSHYPAGGESMLWQLGLQVIDPGRRLVRTFLRWQDVDPTDPAIYLDGPAFVLPTGTMLLTGSRERTATGYVGRFGVNGRASQASIVAPMTIGAVPAVTGSVSIMATPDPGDPLTRPTGYVELVDVQARAASVEELELVGRRFAEIAPRMELAIRRYTGGPMRDVWSQEPESLVQRELRVQAGLLAYARSELEIVGRYAGPLTSWGELLERWEAITELPPGDGDGFDVRRARLATHLALDGSSLDDLRAALAAPFGQLASAVAIEENTSVGFRDDFDATTTSGGYYTGGHDAEAWIKGGAVEYTFLRTGSVYRISRVLAADDLRWQGRMLSMLYRPPTDAHPPFLLHATGEGGVDTVWQTRIEAMTVPADNILGGLIIGDLEADDWTWVGAVKIGAAWTVRWARRVGEDLTVAASLRHLIGPTAWSASLGAVGAGFAATSIRVRETDTPGTWEVQVVTGADPADWSVVAATTIAGATPRPRWGGPGIIGLSNSVTGALTVDWGYYDEHSPHTPHDLTWHAYRDPALAGSYDLVAAQAVLDRYGPAHADATAIDRHRSLVYEDATTLLDRDPVGT